MFYIKGIAKNIFRVIKGLFRLIVSIVVATLLALFVTGKFLMYNTGVTCFIVAIIDLEIIAYYYYNDLNLTRSPALLFIAVGIFLIGFLSLLLNVKRKI